ncbi:hypothetical protein IT568_07515 [bacterium]|nr:hypothetical protein [bacterium]
MNKSLLTLLATTLACTNLFAANITGTVTNVTTGALKTLIVAALSQLPTAPIDPTNLPYSQTNPFPFSTSYNYSLQNVPNGSYYVMAFQDVNANSAFDVTDKIGYFGGTIPTQIVVSGSNQTGKNIALAVPPTNYFAGNISYSGTDSGPTVIFAYNNQNFTGTPSAFNLTFTGNGNGNYEVHLANGTYYAMAFMDKNSNLQLDSNEPRGFFGSLANPTQIVIANGNAVNKNITMFDDVLLPVTDLQITTLGNNAQLFWTQIPNATSYKIYKSTNEPTTMIFLTTVATTNFTDTNAVSNNTNVFYTVTANN